MGTPSVPNQPGRTDEEHHPHPASLVQRRFISQLLLTSVDQTSTVAATAFIDRWPDIGPRYNPLAFDRWKESFAGRIVDLASAIMSGTPGVFVDQVAWARVAFQTRGVPSDDLARSLDMLGEVLERFLPDEDELVVQHYLRAAGKSLYQAVVEPPTSLSINTPQGNLAARFLLATLEGERFEASQLVLDAVRTSKLSVRDAYEHVLMPVMREVGRLWHINDLSVAEEHFVSTTAQLTMGQLYPFLTRAPRNGKTVAAASVEGNTHDMGVRMVADYFEMAGWRVIFLGANVPSSDLALAVGHFQADLLCLCACLPTHLRSVEEAIRATRSTERGTQVRILVGGPAFTKTGCTWREMGADGYASDATTAVLEGTRLAGL